MHTVFFGHVHFLFHQGFDVAPPAYACSEAGVRASLADRIKLMENFLGTIYIWL
jgi:hypothetical protein